jgi:hypothetical protein
MFSVLVAVLSLLASEMGAQAENPADVAAARDLFREGLELSRAEQWEAAREKLAQSLALKQAAITYYTLAVAEKNSGHAVAALEHLRAFLALPSSPDTQRFEAPAREAIAELEGTVAEVTVMVKPADAPELRVRIGDEDVPLAGLGRARLIDPGTYQVRVEAKGYTPVSKRFTVVAGGGVTMELSLDALPEPEPIEGGGEEAPFPVGPVILLGAGAAVLVAGLAVGLVGVKEAGDAPTSDGPEADAARSKALAGDILAGIGGAAAGAGLVWLIVELTTGAPANTDARARLLPWVSRQGLGAELRF